MTKVLVIAGWERSGSTILANVLGSAPATVAVGEINNIWERGFGDDLLCACGSPFGSCPWWRPTGQTAFGADFPAVAERAATVMAPMGNTWLIRQHWPGLGYGQDDRGGGYAALLGPLYRAIADASHAALIVDASKSPWHAAVAHNLDGFEVFVLHLVRDPRGVAHSLRKKVRYDVDGERPRYMDRHGVTKSSLAWLYRSSIIDSHWAGDPRFMRMRYEDFTADPETATRLIFSWLGLPEAAVPFNRANELEMTLSHNVSGNPVRFQSGTVAIRQDESWRRVLPPAAAAWVRVVAWPKMRAYGYGR